MLVWHDYDLKGENRRLLVKIIDEALRFEVNTGRFNGNGGMVEYGHHRFMVMAYDHPGGGFFYHDKQHLMTHMLFEVHSGMGDRPWCASMICKREQSGSEHDVRVTMVTCKILHDVEAFERDMLLVKMFHDED